MADPVTPSFLDTSIVVRYLTDDPPPMAEAAARIIEGEETLIISELALMEAAYTLASVYGLERDMIVDLLASLLQRENLTSLTLPKSSVLEALDLCRGSKRVSFGDALLWAQARDAGAARLYSFDRRFPSKDLEVVGFTG
mgnify:CR=1 FL=1